MAATRPISVSRDLIRLCNLPPHAIVADTTGELAELANYAHCLHTSHYHYPQQYFDLVWSELAYFSRIKLGGHIACWLPESGCTPQLRQAYMICGLQIVEPALRVGLLVAVRVF